MSVYYIFPTGLTNNDLDLTRATVGCPEVGVVSNYKLVNKPPTVSKLSTQQDVLDDRYNDAGRTIWERQPASGI